METYKKPVVASKNELPNSMIMAPRPFPLRKLLGGDDLHVEKALTTRKDVSK